MYMILWWKHDGDFLTAITNEDSSIRLFATLEEADDFANKQKDSEDLRVISIEGAE